MRRFWKMGTMIIGGNVEWVGKKGSKWSWQEVESPPLVWNSRSFRKILQNLECRLQVLLHRAKFKSSGHCMTLPPSFFSIFFLDICPLCLSEQGLRVPVQLAAYPPSPPAPVQGSVISSSWHLSQQGSSSSCTPALLLSAALCRATPALSRARL